MLLSMNYANAQQSIGSFPQMDGGFEGQNAGTLISTGSSSTPDATFWARGGTSGAGNATIVSSGARSGSNYITVVNTKNTVNTSPRTYVSPASPVLANTSYVIQFYCKATDGVNFPNTTLQAGLSSATGTAALYKTFIPTGAANVFSKYYVIDSSTSAAPNNGFSAVKISSNTANVGYALDIDDWVVYPGTSIDTLPPAVPGTASVMNPTGTSLNISWGNASDVDGGGYLVIRYTSNPVSEPNPNLNGIYQVGNSIGNGEVAYIGTANSFTNLALSNNTTYYYRVYTVDKAFNYSSFVTTSGTTNTAANAIRYYIDSIAGNDNNDGSLLNPWKNVSKLNTMTLVAGTEVFLKCGSSWTGQKLKFRGSGIAGNPIKVTSYGTGADPLLAGNGIIGEAVVYLYNQQYIEISNLEITNSPNGPVNADFFVGIYSTTGTNPNPLGGDRRGVMVALDNFGTANHIYLKNLNIHHIKGQLGNGTTTVNGAIPKRTGGIFFTVLGNTETTNSKSRFNDVLIDSNNIGYCENIGIALDNEWNVYYPGGTEYTDWYNRRYSNIKVSHNTVHHIGKNAMIIRCTDETGLIEHNVCYETAMGTTGNTMFTARAKGTVFQYNEGYYNRSTTQNVDPGNIDGSMYDPDFGSIGIIFQYSYSHDNSEGIYWGCNTRGSNNNTTGIPDVQDTGCTLRYCISQNDKGRLIYFNYSSAGNEIYNNVFYTKSSLSPTFIVENDGNNHKYNFYNNIIYNLSSSSSYSWGSGTGVQTRTFSNNVFYGNHPSSEPSDPFKITADPKFVNPGSGVSTILFLDGYKLQNTSPALNNGKIISNNGGFDFYGTPLPSTAPNRGVYQTVQGTSSVFTVSACSSYTWQGNTYTTSTNTPTWVTTNVAGFDSTITLHLTILQPTSAVVTASACSSYTWHGNTYTASTNTPTWSTTNAAGCDSIVTVHLTILQPTSSVVTASACSTYTWHGNTYTTSTNTPTWTTTNAVGCDSVVTLHLIILQPTSSVVTASACSSYTWHGNTYTASTNTPTWTTTNANGCDSVVTLNLTISNQPTSSIVTASACSSYTWHGNIYTASTNTPTWTTTNANGCDSVVTLHLTISNQPTSSVVTVLACSTYTWHGNTYTVSTNTPTWITTNVNGCDSVVTLHLTINYQPTSSVITESACSSFTWHGNTYIASTNTPTWTTTNAAGCDSVITLHLTINEPSSSVVTASACSSYTWHGNTYLASTNTPTWVTTNAVGCDSIETLHLTINQSSSSIETYSADSFFIWHDSIYTTSTNSATWVTTNAAGCDSIITLHLTILSSQVENNSPIILYPNPAEDFIKIKLQGNMMMAMYGVICSSNGQKITNNIIINSEITTVQIKSLASGVYYLRLYDMLTGTFIKTISFIKHK